MGPLACYVTTENYVSTLCYTPPLAKAITSNYFYIAENKVYRGDNAADFS